jgi:gluconate 5-dehydrogenase
MMNGKDYVHGIFGCSGRKAVVTGASSGLGAEMARALARAGADVLIVARRRERLEALAEELAAAEGRVFCCVADLSKRSDLALVAEQAAEQLAGCDILVANAGTANRVPLKSMDEGDFSAILDLNITAQWLLSKALFPLLSASQTGRIVNIASVYGLGASAINGLGAYTTSKHALIGLTRSQAVEWARDGITANANAPGYFPTEMTQTALEDEKMGARLRAFTPQARFGDPSELIPALLFLCSAANTYVTGTVVAVDGGWTAW